MQLVGLLFLSRILLWLKCVSVTHLGQSKVRPQKTVGLQATTQNRVCIVEFLCVALFFSKCLLSRARAYRKEKKHIAKEREVC